MKNQNIFPCVRVNGTHFETGFKIGQHFKERIQRAFQECKALNDLQKLDQEKPERIDKVESLAKKHFPQYMDEIIGVAEGSCVDYRAILVANFRHVPPKDDRIENCSTVIFKRQNDIILAHNEDFESISGKYSYLVMVELENGTSFFAHAYPGCIPGISFGFNSHGIVVTTNSLPNPIKRIGLTRIFFGRSILEAKTLHDAINRAQSLTPRSGGASYNIASMREKKIINLETTAEESCLTEISDVYMHTNHYISEKFNQIPQPKFGDSKVRYRRGMSLLPDTKRTGKGALSILSDKYMFFNALKGPSGYLLDTICTAIFNVSTTINLKLHPHDREKKEYMQFSLNDLE